MTPVLDIIIVNWNTGQQLKECLASIAAAQSGNLQLGRVVVVDNNSADGSADQLDFPALPLVVYRNSDNRGFAAACNQGAVQSQADYLLFLNPDTRVFVDSLARPVSFLQAPANQQTGICGIQLVDAQGQVQRTCARFPSAPHFLHKALGLDKLLPHRFPVAAMHEWDHGSSALVDQVMGAFFLVRRQVFEALRGFDERFFVYFEDVDFSLRARQAGWLTYYLAETQSYHRGGGASDQIKSTRLFYSLRSRLQYGLKHYRPGEAWLLLMVTLLLEPLARCLQAIPATGSGRGVETCRAYARLWRSVRSILAGRSRKR